MNVGKGCDICIATIEGFKKIGGAPMMVSPEECMGCSGLVACNYSYFPDIFNEDGTRKETQNASTESGRS